MRSRLWSLILRELPFPFRQIGLEVARIVRWFDHTAARLWTGLRRSPAWYFVTVTGATVVLLTGLLFFSFFANHDPTLGELTAEGSTYARAARTRLEAAGEWSAQDRWRVAHLFVDHRPPRRRGTVRLDSRLIEEPTARDADEVKLDPEVRLELNVPDRAAQSRRFVEDRLAREPSIARATTLNIQPRDSRLMVQAEWASAVDCNSEVPQRPLARRAIPVPEPMWDEPEFTPTPRVQGRPDLSVQIELLREFLSAVGEFPPRSRATTVTARSEFPHPTTRKRQSPSFASHLDEWNEATAQAEADHRRMPEAYITRIRPEEEQMTVAAHTEEDEPDIASFAEVTLRLELYAPETAMAGRLHESSLRIHNEGQTPVSLVQVRESLSELQTVTDANPAARVDHDLLERDVHRLPPGRDRRLGVTWWPNEEGSRVHRAAVTMHAAVGATTNVVTAPPETVEPPAPRVVPESPPAPDPHPALTFDVRNPDRVLVDDVVELELLVRNTGNTALHDVRILAEIPAELKHRQGTEVEYEVGDLPLRGSHRAVLRLLAQSPGQTVSRLQISARESVESKARAVVTVSAKPPRSEPPRATEAPRSKPTPTPRPVPKPALKPFPMPQPTSGGCCCPGQPVALILKPCFIP